MATGNKVLSLKGGSSTNVTSSVSNPKCNLSFVIRLISIFLACIYCYSQTTLLLHEMNHPVAPARSKKPPRDISAKQNAAEQVRVLRGIVPFTATNKLKFSKSGVESSLLSTVTESSALPASEEGMAACLLIKDDNHLLIEWLAYHYLTLPLRYLVIAVDPDSFSSPLPIINRWNNSEDGMQIMLWTDQDYMEQQHLAARLHEKIKQQTTQNSTSEREKLDRDRQARFVSECNMYHKDQGRTWVAHIDLDEFVVFNYVHEDDMEVHKTPENHSNKRESLPKYGEGTVMSVLSKQNSVWTQNGCMAMIRILFGPKQNENEKETQIIDKELSPSSSQRVLSLRQQSSFTTLKYFYHSGAGSKQINGLQKALVDVSKINRKLLENSFSIHRPIRRICPAAYYRGKSYHHSLFRVHHYLGSWEYYSTNMGDKANSVEYQEKALASSAHGPNYDIKPWLNAFIEKVGVVNAQYLLKGVTELEDGNNQLPVLLKSKPNTCALLFFGIPRSFSSIVFPSIQQHILDQNPDCDVYVHSYDVEFAKNPAVEEEWKESGDVEVMELAAFKGYFEKKSASYHSVLETEEEFQKERNITQFRRLFPRPSAWEYPISMDNMVRQWHSIEKVWLLMNTVEQKEKQKYDRVGLFRLDAKYTHPINIMTTEVAVIPAMMYESRNKVSGINDSMFYGNRDVAKIWSTERFQSVRNYMLWQKRNEDRVFSKGLHPEEFLRYLLVEKWSIEITLRNICFQRVRTSGKVLRDCDVFGDSVTGDETVRGVVVLGMHRSGTSLLSGLLVHGLSYKSPGQLIAANSQNPYGFYENFDVARQNDRWLKEQGKTWDRLSMTTSPTNSSVIINGFSTALSCATDSCKEASKSSRDYQYFEHRNKALVHYNDPSNAPWIMKDPRLCVTFKMWLEILHGAPPAVIFTYRNPLEVARSLQGRERETVELLGDGLKLWIWYNRLAVDNSKGLCRITTSNEAVMKDPKLEVIRIREELIKCGLPQRSIKADAVEEFFNEEFMHSTSKGKDVSDSTVCVIPPFHSSLVNPDAKKAEEEIYQVAMKVFCDLKSGEAFKLEYQWPVIV